MTYTLYYKGMYGASAIMAQIEDEIEAKHGGDMRHEVTKRMSVGEVMGTGISVDDSPTRSNALNQRVNIQRASIVDIHTPPLEWKGWLYSIAKERVERMINERWYGHRDPTGAYISVEMRKMWGADLVHWGENIMWGCGEPEQAYELFMRSASHRFNIERPEYDSQASVFAFDPTGGTYHITETDTYNHLGPNWFIVHAFATLRQNF